MCAVADDPKMVKPVFAPMGNGIEGTRVLRLLLLVQLGVCVLVTHSLEPPSAALGCASPPQVDLDSFYAIR